MSIFKKLVNLSPAFATSTPAPRVSDRYVHISSEKIVNLIETKGWTLDAASKVLTKGSNPYGKHSAQFRHPDLNFEIRPGDRIHPIIRFINAHNGLSSLQFFAGFFREVCSNGLMVPVMVGDVENTYLKLRHINLTPESLYDMLQKATDNLYQSVDTLTKFAEYNLTEEQVHNYAKTAIRRRMQTVSNIPSSEFDWNVEVAPNILEGVITTQFEQDKGRTAWEIYNNVQGALLERGFKVYDPVMDRFKKIRPLKSFGRVSKLNAQLFTDMRELIHLN